MRYSILSLALLAMTLSGCDMQQDAGVEGAPLPIRIAIPMQPTSGLALIAREQGFFEKRGLAVSYSEYPSGKRALDEGLLAGKADVAFSAEVPIVAAALAGKDFRVIATTFRASNVNRVIARTDHGIHIPNDLKGKKVATQQASAVHFFLHLFLIENGLSTSDIKLSYLKAEELVPALVSGSIDAFSMREPFIGEAKAQLGDNAIVFSVSGLYQQFDSALVGTPFLQQQPQAVKRLLLALRDAEDYVRQHPEEALTMGARILGVSATDLSHLWENRSLMLALEQSYLLTLEDISRWLTNEKLVEDSTPADFLNVIDAGPLQSLDSKRISLIR
ncbi:MAG: NrtA/SsuA/CpmA family ABC transporter substrate-binding protein [Pseudomonadota bacterium]